MSLPLKRKREVSPEFTGVACSSTSGSHANGRGRGRDRGRGRGRSFHIPRRASQTTLLTEVWKHRTHSTYAYSSQLGPVPPEPPTILPTLNSEAQPGVINETPPLLHKPADANSPHNLDDFVNSSQYQDARPQQVHRPNRPLRQAHRNKRQNQASTWKNQVIPMLLEPFMDLLRRTKSGRVSVSPPAPNDGACSCSPVTLKITCVSWNC